MLQEFHALGRFHQRVTFSKGSENRRTSRDSELLRWGGEVLEDTQIPVCFCAELEQKATFQNFPLKGKWGNVQFRKKLKMCFEFF